MLSRSAQGLYWMGRYLERVEHVSRLMELQVSALVDRPVQDIHFGWWRLYNHLRVDPPLGALQEWSEEEEEWQMVDSFALTDDMTFTRTNEHSIYACFEAARENARQIRHCVSFEMWICLNKSYFRIRDQSIEDIWTHTPQQFYADLVEDVSTFMGVAAGTLYRDEGWDFLQIGRMIEHAQLMCSLLAVQLNAKTNSDATNVRDYLWSSLLSCFSADEAYQHYYGMKMDPENVLDMLVTDVRLPNSVFFSLDQISSRIQSLGDAPSRKTGALADRFAGRLTSLFKYEWPDAEEKARMLTLAESFARRLHEQISSAWFNYEVEDTSRI